MKLCVVCNNKLFGRQKKFCSRACKNQNNNALYQSYTCQQKRGRKRKLKLIAAMGSKCSICDYDKNFAALIFHHVKPERKSFPLELRSLSNRTWESILNEAEKCRLLCANCHAEIHNPGCSLAK